MAKMQLKTIEQRVEEVINHYDPDTFIFDLLAAYGKAKATLSRLKSGNYNLSKNKNEIRWKNHLYFKAVDSNKLRDAFNQVCSDDQISKDHPRFILLTDHKRFYCADTKANTFLIDLKLEKLVSRAEFFLPWAGQEKTQYDNNYGMDRKAAALMTKLYDAIEKNNPVKEGRV